jgi:hypothetical protein
VTNAEVIQQLDRTIEKLVKRREETEAILGRPIDPAEFPDVEKRVIAQATSLTLRIHNLRTRRRNRELAESLNTAVPSLPAARVAAMRAALEQVAESIAAVQSIQMALALAARISQSASDMFDATA